jgi:DNA repair photolyase
MGLYGGLKPEDWQRWGQFTTFKENAPALLRRTLRPSQIIYCSPLVDPYQPAEASECQMPAILRELIDSPPLRFVFQTRSPMIVRDLDLIRELASRTAVRVSFSLTTDREDIRRLYEPHCEPLTDRLAAIAALRRAGIVTHATLAPMLPSNPEELARLACEATATDLIGDPLHVRAVKKTGATTRDAAFKISNHHGHGAWFDPDFQMEASRRMAAVAATYQRKFLTGPEGFRLLTVN